jgi:hypothetical protein
VADFVTVVSWQDESGNSFSIEESKEGHGTANTKLNKLNPESFPLNCYKVEKLIVGKMQITVVTQYYEAEVVSEYVIRGNTAVLKCNIPSFVADFVKVEAWVDSNGGEYLLTDDIGI